MSLRVVFTCLSASLLLAACSSSDQEEDNQPRILDSKQIYRLLPARTMNRMSWATDMSTIMDDLHVERNLNNVCSIIAIADQESNINANPPVADLGHTALKEMNRRLEKYLGKTMAGYFDQMMKKQPSPDDSFMHRVKRLRTEKDLDLLYRDMFDFYTKHYHVSLLTGAASVLSGQSLEEKFNPIRTLGSMQVDISYAVEHSRSGGNIHAIRDDMYTQSGGLYYGISRLMTYPAAYDRPIYRFADFNVGMYASRNASIQMMISKLTNLPLDLDGDLLAYDKQEKPLSDTTDTEKAVLQLSDKKNLGLSQGQIRQDFLKARTIDFEKTDTYQKVRQAYQDEFHEKAPYAIMPNVPIAGPKLSHVYNTSWYANKVNARYLHCFSSGRRMGFRASLKTESDNDSDSDQ